MLGRNVGHLFLTSKEFKEFRSVKQNNRTVKPCKKQGLNNNILYLCSVNQKEKNVYQFEKYSTIQHHK